ncbi:MAG: hypothetical protein Q9192_008087 [Flavoplaca navasiana]
MEQTTNLSYNDKLDVREGEDAPGPSVHHKTQNAPDDSIKSSNLSRSKFLQLPAEIRLRIYSFSLKSPSPIIVWSAESHNGNYRPTHKRTWKREKMASSRRNLALGLLRCSTTVAAESAQLFYSRNTFRFEGDHEYYPVITWLDKLNDNREYLESLEITVRKPITAWQLPDGSRHKMDYPNTRGLASHHPYFAPRSGPYEEGEVEIIDPAIETIISLLAKYGGDYDQRKVTLYLDPGYYKIPGIVFFEQEGTSLFSLDLPNLVDIWRTKYFSGRNHEALKILWKGEININDFPEKRHLIEGVGWKIFDVHEGEYIYNNRIGWPGKDIVVPSIQFLMRRDEVIGPIMAAGPDLYTRWYAREFVSFDD